MENRTKRVRGSNWNHAQTVALAELKRKASLNEELGSLVWERIAHTLSSRFPGQIRTGAQCRRRWDTLVKVYNHIENYCVETGQDHRELDEAELASMKLDTAYHQDWYDTVEQVCSQRKWKESCDRDLMLAKQSKGSSTGFHAFELRENPPNRHTHHTLCSASTSNSVAHREQSTPKPISTYTQVPFNPSLEDKLSPWEELPRFVNENDAFMLEATQLWQHGQVYHEFSQEPQALESVNQLPYTLPAENGAKLKEPLQYNWWDTIEFAPLQTSIEIEQPETESYPCDMYFCDPYIKSGGFRVQRVQDYVRDDWPPPLTASAPKPTFVCALLPAWNLTNGQPYSLPYTDLWRPQFGAHSWGPPNHEWRPPAYHGSSYAGGLGFGPEPRNYLPSAAIKSGCDFGNKKESIPSATMTSSTSSRSSYSTISRQRRRWSLKVILLNIFQCCHPCGRK